MRASSNPYADADIDKAQLHNKLQENKIKEIKSIIVSSLWHELTVGRLDRLVCHMQREQRQRSASNWNRNHSCSCRADVSFHYLSYVLANLLALLLPISISLYLSLLLFLRFAGAQASLTFELQARNRNMRRLWGPFGARCINKLFSNEPKKRSK